MGMKGYKGFAPGLICKGKQYAENTVFEEEKAEICECGMHFCENPLDVLEHYPPVNEKGVLNEFAEVEALDECGFCQGLCRQLCSGAGSKEQFWVSASFLCI